MKGKYDQISYVAGFNIDYGTGITLPIFKTKKIVVSSTKRFNNNLHKTAKLPPSARNLLDFLVQRMNESNEVQNSFLLRQDFIFIMKRSCSLTYKEDSVNKAFQALKASDLLIPYAQKKGVYIVNPVYFFNGTFNARKFLIQKLLAVNSTGKHNHAYMKKALGFE